MMVNYHTVFISGGVMYGIWQDKMKASMRALQKTAFWPVFIVGGVMLFGIFQPGNYSDVGYMFFFPMYSDTIIQSLFTTGSWLVVYFVNWLMEYECNKIYNANTYKLFTGSSMNAYLCHDLWIQFTIYFFIWPFTP